MPLPNGLYKVTWDTPAGTEYGVAYLLDGRLRGGDSGLCYVGTYQQQGQLFTAEMSVTRHRHVPGAIAALGLDDVLVELTGVVEEGAALRVRGTSPESSAVRFSARLAMIAD
ncbi:GrlR family regulatory protein [Sphingomonas endolithica]|uniref:GrlR family regulatory protein n=1 Tax=Sphingomonas endolithica TaxID=2972485 RepID=UPI0021AF4AE2|nr:GrlR family regulatory protein [Sphingomonas sp. ZFBP2030]